MRKQGSKFGEMDDSRTRTGNIQSEPGVSYTRMSGSTQKTKQGKNSRNNNNNKDQRNRIESPEITHAYIFN